MKPKQKSFLQNLDWVTTILPFGCITLLCCLFMIFPEALPISLLPSVSSLATSLAAIIC